MPCRALAVRIARHHSRRGRTTTHNHGQIRVAPSDALCAVIAQIFQHLAAGLIALLRLFCQGLHHYGTYARMDGRIDLPRRDRNFIDNFIDDRGDVLAGEGLFAGQHFVEHDAQRKNVAAAVHRAPLHLLGRHVAGRAHDVRGLLGAAELKNLGSAEVRDLDGVVGGQHQVGGLDVAVNNVAFMGVLQRAAGLVHDAQRAGQGKGMSAIQKSLQALAFHQLHGDVVEAVFFAGVVDHHDVGMGEQTGGACFCLKPRH